MLQHNMQACKLQKPRLAFGAGRSLKRCVPHAAQQASQSASVDDRISEQIAALMKAAGGHNRVALEQVKGGFEGVAQLGQELQLNRVVEEYVPGCFEQILTTDQRMFEGDVTTMARFTFGQFKPLDLQISLSKDVQRSLYPQTGLPDLYRGPLPGGVQNGYIIHTHFRIIESDSAAAQQQQAPLDGILSAIAEYVVMSDAAADSNTGAASPASAGSSDGGATAAAASGAGPARKMGIRFKGLRLEPVPDVVNDASRLGRWLALLKPHNQGMDEHGVLEVSLPGAGPLGVIEYMLMGKDYQVHVGNMGSHIVVKRVTPPPGTMGAKLLAAH